MESKLFTQIPTGTESPIGIWTAGHDEERGAKDGKVLPSGVRRATTDVAKQRIGGNMYVIAEYIRRDRCQ
ncbi:uncharacterized protein IUM83_06402 [Phytophthora cinnamomi]|uniref:uncharacterized protein n=1 Tax=Phytophthora cinnamomi TaxID=4785 RepID=UPI003559841B|nr:hypothetical protein IUM83_06402 [Phytophthora cinnamomi]